MKVRYICNHHYSIYSSLLTFIGLHLVIQVDKSLQWGNESSHKVGTHYAKVKEKSCNEVRKVNKKLGIW